MANTKKDSQVFFRVSESEYNKLITLAYLKGKKNPNDLMKNIALELIDDNKKVILEAEKLRDKSI